jgi:carbonic anhydrase/acetyltransferase-like protein (isoleucine patch superfamily)
LHGCAVEDECLIGIGAVILNGARIGRASVVAAGALVPEGMVVPPESVVMGAPATVKRGVRPEEKERFARSNRNYVDYRRRYLEERAGEQTVDSSGQGHA